MENGIITGGIGMTSTTLRRLFWTGGSIIALAWGSTAAAQTAGQTGAATAAAAAATSHGLEEVVVTARRRSENLQRTPVAITALSSQTLEQRHIVSLVDVSKVAPNLTFYATSGSLGGAGAFMRGIGYADNTVGQDAPIAIYVDGVYNGRFTVGAMQLVEPAQVEVLRGPQGTLFGRNTTGGAISITTHVPSNEFGGEAKISYGSFRQITGEARIDTGLIANTGIKLSVAYAHDQRDATHKTFLTSSDQGPGSYRNDALWFKGMGSWGNLSAILTGDHSELSGIATTLQIVDGTAAFRNMVALSPSHGGSYYPIVDTPLFNIPSDTNAGVQHVKSEGIGLTLTYKVADYLNIKLISAARDYTRNDPSAYGPGNLAVNTPTVGNPGLITFFNGAYGFLSRGQSQHQYSEELQLSGTLGDFDYVGGAYWFTEHAFDHAFTQLPFPLGAGATGLTVNTPRAYTVDSRTVAGFAQVNYRPSYFDKKLEISGGIRYTADKRTFNQTQALVRSAALSTVKPNYLASISYQWTPGIMTFFRFSTGYRAGGFNARASACPGTPGSAACATYLPENLESYEAGLKLEAFDHRLRMNASGFYNTYRNLQVTQFVAPGAAGAGGNTAVNTNASYRGFEVEVEAIPIDRLTLDASVGYVNPKYSLYPKALLAGKIEPGCYGLIVGGAVVGQNCAPVAQFVAVPKVTADISGTYVFPMQSYGEWSMRLNYSWRDKTTWYSFALPTSNFFNNALTGDSYGLLSARLMLSKIPMPRGATAQISIYGDNLTDERYINQGIDFSYFATIVWGDPRTVGIEAKVNF
jgi:iron complex outermembrane receptor protein